MVAQQAGLAFIDTDALIETAAGRPVHQVFAEDGEAGFRQMEREAVRAACTGRGAAIATGGGAVLDPNNRRRLWQDNLVVWLDAQPESILPRVAQHLAQGGIRPLLAADPLARLRELRSQRAPLYAQAHARIETDRLTLDEVASQVLDLWQKASRENRIEARRTTPT